MSLQTAVQSGGVTYTCTPASANDYTHTQARRLACHTVGENRGFQTLIEQSRHLQASVRSYIRAERRSI